MKKKHLFLDIHAIQTLPPSNVNRDDTGSPKAARYGGVIRARVSSQAWKKAMRDYFRVFGPEACVGVRTKNVGGYVAQKICEKDSSVSMEDARQKAEDVLKAAGLKFKEGKLAALFFLGEKQAERLAEAALAGEKDKAALGKILKENPEMDMALFGRMLADDPAMNIDASAQVAHAISTHEVQTEYDYFIAEDDYEQRGNAGAAHLDTMEYNSSTLYRYADVAVHEFYKQMGEDKDTAVNALKLFINAFVYSMPSGKENSYANRTIPQAVLVTLRDDRPISLVSAYEKPVRSQDGYVDKSIQLLLEENRNADKFVHEPVASWCLMARGLNRENKNIFKGEEEQTMSDLLKALSDKLNELL